MIFGEHLLAWRRHRGLTQNDLAEAARIPQPNIAALESGRGDPQLSTLRRLASALHLTTGELLDKRPPHGAWNRHRIDALVRRAVNHQSTKDDDRLAHRLRMIAAHKLTAAGKRVALRGRTGERLARQLRAELGPELWAAVVRRLDKLV